MPSFNPESTATDFSELTSLLVLLCDGELDDAEWDRLESLLLDDPAAQDFYRRFIGVDVDLAWRAAKGRGEVQKTAESQIRNRPVLVGVAVELPHQLDVELSDQLGEPPVLHAETIIPPIIIDSGSPSSSLFHSSLGAWLFSYAAATVITGMAILGAWVYRVSHDYQLAVSPPAAARPAEKKTEPELEYVGQVTGVADCQWLGSQAVPVGALTALGRRYELAAGLLEIGYDSGAKVILQGPCIYEVDSAAGGYLSLGKLTARVEGSEVRGQGSEHSPLSPLSSPLFSVRTPTAVVTDLGTEFGVEVNEAGHTESHVFVGKVKMAPIGAPGKAVTTAILGAGQSARCRKGNPVEIVPAAAPERFVRSLEPETMRIVEKFDGPKLGPALEQSPPGRYLISHGAAVYQQPAGSRQSRGYIRTVATDFCDCDFACEVTVDVRLDAADLASLKHEIFFGIGSGEPNPNLYDEMTCGLAMVFVVDTRRIYVQARRPGDSISHPLKDADDLCDFAPSGPLLPGRHRLRMEKRGQWLQFFVDADYSGTFQADFQTRWLDLAAIMPELNSTNSRLVLGAGNCDTMSVRFEDLSIVRVKQGGTIEPSPQGGAATEEKGVKAMNGP